MKRKKIYSPVYFFVLTLLILSITSCSSTNPSANKFKSYLITKYGFTQNDLSLITRKNGFVIHPFMGGATTVPARAQFATSEGQIITVSFPDNHFADDYQLKNIGYFSATYFTKLLDRACDFVVFRSTYNGNDIDFSLSSYLENHNDYIDDSSINKFLLGYWSETGIKDVPEVDMELYVPVQISDDIQSIIDAISVALTEFVDSANLSRVDVYLYQKKQPLKISTLYSNDYNSTTLLGFDYYYVDRNDLDIKYLIFYCNSNGNERNDGNGFDKKGEFFIKKYE